MQFQNFLNKLPEGKTLAEGDFVQLVLGGTQQDWPVQGRLISINENFLAVEKTADPESLEKQNGEMFKSILDQYDGNVADFTIIPVARIVSITKFKKYERNRT